MTTQEENELICERLLGWKTSSILGYWFPSQERAGTVRTPSFTTWAEAGLILVEFNQRKLEVDICIDAGECWVTIWNPKPRSTAKSADLPPLIRAAALEYIRSLP